MTEWSPESELDPEKIQKEMLELGKELLDKHKADKESEEKRRAMAKEVYSAPELGIGVPMALYRELSFDEMALCVAKAWSKTVELTLGAPPEVVASAYRDLVASALREASAKNSSSSV